MNYQKSLSVLKGLLVLGYAQGWNSHDFVAQKFEQYDLYAK